MGMQEPVFVARPGGSAEDDGWLLVMVNNGESQRTDLCILDAQHVSNGAATPPTILRLSFCAYKPWTCMKYSHGILLGIIVDIRWEIDVKSRTQRCLGR